MADQPKESTPEKAEGGGPQSRAVDAVHHVGPTLESEEEQVYVPRRETIPDEQRAEAAEAGLHVHTIEKQPGEERASEHESSGAEPLHTRLAGDTSSDPHTDVDQK